MAEAFKQAGYKPAGTTNLATTAPRKKGVCRKCGKRVGRGVGLHARRCDGNKG